MIVDPNRICSKVNRLRSRQVYICKREPTIISQIINGSFESVRECQYQFSDRKWNCPTKNKRSMRKLLSKGKHPHDQSINQSINFVFSSYINKIQEKLDSYMQ